MSQEEIERRVRAMLENFAGKAYEVALGLVIVILTGLFVILMAKKIISYGEAMYIVTGKGGYIAGGVDNEKT